VTARPTIRDVALLAGVSIKTVSRVTNGDPAVTMQTAQRVGEAIRALAYKPNPLARSLRTGQDEAVGLVVESIADPFFAAVTSAVEEEARAAGLFLIIASAGNTADEERAVVVGLLHRSIRGLLIVACKLDYRVERLPIGPGGVPVVFIDRPSGLDADTVLVDNEEVARHATEHLLAHGHRRIAFVGTEIASYPVVGRYAGYLHALAGAGLQADSDLVVSHRRPMIDRAPVLGRVLDLADPATAVLTANALTSMVVVRELHRLRRTDVALMSIDDFPVADALTPAISVARQDPAQMGRQAFDALRRRMLGDTSAPQQILIPTSVVARGSGELRPRVGRRHAPRRPARTGDGPASHLPRRTGEHDV
jgi:LacI family transcriptional regulator